MSKMNCFNKFIAEEEAQATVEYMLMLAVALMLLFLITNNFIKPLFKKMRTTLEKQLGSFFSTNGFHHLKLRR